MSKIYTSIIHLIPKNPQFRQSLNHLRPFSNKNLHLHRIHSLIYLSCLHLVGQQIASEHVTTEVRVLFLANYLVLIDKKEISPTACICPIVVGVHFLLPHDNVTACLTAPTDTIPGSPPVRGQHSVG